MSPVEPSASRTNAVVAAPADLQTSSIHEKENNNILPNDVEGAQTNKRSSIDFLIEI